MNTKKQGRRRFTGNFEVLLNHNNQNPDIRYAKRMAKKQLKAYLTGHPTYNVQRRIMGVVTFQSFKTPQIFE